MYFGYYPAKLIHIIGYIPNRINGALTVFAAQYTFGDFNGKNAQYIHLRHRYKALSAYAGALGITLKGNIGDDDNTAAPKDLRTATNLLRNTCMIYQVLLVILLLIF
ncbi:MAG: hypothetical protein J6P79_01960 [Pseudobutyrivibrio sp.]|nr:hypothetical protein [Pseudobutyrivibrio sp.]